MTNAHNVAETHLAKVDEENPRIVWLLRLPVTVSHIANQHNTRCVARYHNPYGDDDSRLV